VAPADALADIHIRAPTRGNRRLDQLFEAVNGDLQVKAWWHMAGIYSEPERSIVVAEVMHAVISHRSTGRPLTVEGGIVRVADALDMAKGRSRVEFEAGRLDIHSISAYAIDEVRIEAGEDKAVRVEIEMSNSAGIFQVDEGLGKKLRGTPLAEHIEVIARIEGETEKRLVPVFRL